MTQTGFFLFITRISDKLVDTYSSEPFDGPIIIQIARFKWKIANVKDLRQTQHKSSTETL